MLEVKSPAKLNLFLHITARRDDGYHELQTLFELINLYDTLRFSLRNDDNIAITCAAPGPRSKDNLVYKAAHILRDHALQTGFNRNNISGVSIEIDKVIPMGGGLGGGSANAAYTLLTLNHLWELGFSNDTLAHLGLALGADVPIFIHGRSAWAEGIGEIQTPITIQPCHYLIVTPPCHASTAQLFANPHLNRAMQTLPLPPLDSIINPEEILQQHHNVFEPVARKLYPEINETLDWLSAFGSSALTGTGSSCFVPFTSAEAAKQAYSEAIKKWPTSRKRSKPVQNTTIGTAIPDEYTTKHQCFLVNAKKM